MKHILLKELINEEEQPIYTFDKFNRLHRNGVHIPVNRQTPEEGNMYLNNMRTQDALPYTAGREPPTIPPEQKESISWMDETTETDAAETMDIIHTDDAKDAVETDIKLDRAKHYQPITQSSIHGDSADADGGQAASWKDDFEQGGNTVANAELQARMDAQARVTAAEYQRLHARQDAEQENERRAKGLEVNKTGVRRGDTPPSSPFITPHETRNAKEFAHKQYAASKHPGNFLGSPIPDNDYWLNYPTGGKPSEQIESIGWIAEGDMGFQPGEEVHMCPGCKYPSRGSSCDNPGCFDNPTSSPETKAEWKAQMETDAAAQAERDMIHRVRKQSIGW